MSLVVWLPLTKDLRQQGLNTATIEEVTNVTFDNNGKLGKCLSGGKIKIPANQVASIFNNTSMSIAFWYNNNTSETTGNHSICGFSGNTEGDTDAVRIWDFFNYANPNTFHWSMGTLGGGSLANVFPANTWVHVCVTWNAPTLKIYMDGVLKYTGSGSSNYTFDKSYYISFGRAPQKLSDFRIYNHCLSPMEVKELAKGLVLHYPLNRQGWGQENLVWDTHWDEISTKWSGWGSPPVREIVNTFGKKYLHVKSSDRWQGYSQNQAKRSGVGEITAGEKLTLSYWAYSNTTLTSYPCVGIHWTDGSSIIAQSWPLLTITTTPQKFTTVLTVPSGVSAFNIMVGNGSGTVSGVYEIWVADVKLERGEKSTPWCPNSSDVLATTMGLNSTTEYDCSGLCNNGSKMTNTITYTSDTAKYAVSTHFNGTYDGIIIENLVLKDMINSTITYAFWIKPESESGARSIYFGSYSGISWSIEKTAGNQLRLYWNGSPDETCSGATITDGVWQHICITKNGTNDVKVYINGIQKWTSTATHSNLNFPTTYRIGRDTRSNDGTPYKGLMSDFRIYATALSADDVKSLYQNCATIDPDGTIRGQIRN